MELLAGCGRWDNDKVIGSDERTNDSTNYDHEFLDHYALMIKEINRIYLIDDGNAFLKIKQSTAQCVSLKWKLTRDLLTGLHDKFLFE